MYVDRICSQLNASPLKPFIKPAQLVNDTTRRSHDAPESLSMPIPDLYTVIDTSSIYRNLNGHKTIKI